MKQYALSDSCWIHLKRLILALAAMLVLGHSAQAATDTWTGASSTDWNGTNWTGGTNPPASGDALVFGSVNGQSTNTLTDTLANGFIISSISFNSTALAYTMTGNSITLTGGISNSSTNLETINNSIAMAATRTVTMTTGGGNIALGGTLSGVGGLTTAGAGTLILGGANTYGGTTTVGTGTTVQLGTGGSINSGNALSTVGTGTFDINGNNQTLGALNNAGSVTNSSSTSATLTFGGASSTGAGSYTGNMNVIFNNGPSTSTLSGSWSNTGNVTLNATGIGAITLSTGSVNNAGTITNSGAGTGTTTISAVIGSAVTGVTENSATSTLILSGANTYTGNTTLTAGTLDINNASALGASSNTFIINGGKIDNTTANLITTGTNAQTWNGNFTYVGTHSLTFGAGAITLGANVALTNSGGSTLTETGAVSGAGNLTLNANGGAGITFSGNVNNTGTLTNSGTSGTATLSGGVGSSVTAITENSTGSALTISTAAVSVASGGTTITNSNASGSALLTISGGINGTGALVLNNNSSIANGITISTASGSNVNNAGSITDSGNGTGSVIISAPIGSNVTNISDTSAGNLTLSGATVANNGNITFSGTGATTVTFSAASINNVGSITNNGSTTGATTITGVLGSAVTNITENSATSQLLLNSSNPLFAGTVTVSAGTMKLGSSTSLNAANAVTVSGGTFDINNVVPTIGGLNDGGSSSGTVTNSSATARALTLGGSGTYSYSGVVTATTPANLNLVVALTGGGKQTLTGNNTYTGTLTLTSGILNANTSGIDGSSIVSGITFNGGTLQAASGGISTAKAITMTAAGAFDTNGNASTLSGAITGAGAFTVANSSATAGSLTLTSAANTFSGGLVITDTGGTGNTVIDGNSNINTLGTGTVTMGDHTTLDLGNNAPTVKGLGTSGTGSGVIITNASGIPASVLLTLSNAASTNFAGSITNGTATALGLTLTNGTQILSGTNTYTGVTTITAGTLEFGKKVSLYNNNLANWTAANISVASGATLAVGVGGAGDFTAADIAFLSGVGTASGGFKTGSILGIDTTDGNFTDSNSISNSNGGVNVLGLTKLGTNTLTLSGSNSYTGATKVVAGTLILTQAANDSFTGGVTVTGGDLQINDSNALADSVVTISTTNGLSFNTGLGTAVLAGLSGASNEALQDGSSNSGAAVNLVLGQYKNTTGSAYTGVLSGGGSITKVGSGTQTFGASNTYTGGTFVTANNAGTLGLLGTTLSTSGTPFGTGSVTVNAGTLSFAPSVANSTPAYTIATDPGAIFTYGGAYLKLTRNGTGTVSVTAGNAGATGSILNRVNNGTLIIQADGSGTTASGSTLGTSDFFFVNGTPPAIGNGTTVPAIVNPSIITQTVAGVAGTINNVTSLTTSSTVTSTATTLPVNFVVGSNFLGRTVNSISGTSGNWTIVLSGVATSAVTNASTAYTGGAYGDFVTYDANGFENASGLYTQRGGTTIAASTTTSTEITDIDLNAATFTGNNTTGALLVENGTTATINTGVVLTVGDNTASHQAGIILNGGTITGPGTLNFGADEGIIYGFGSSGVNSIIAGSGGVTFSGNSNFSLQTDVKNTFSGGLTIEGGATVTIGNDNGAGGGHGTQLNSLGDPGNVITLNGGVLSLTGFLYAGRSVVLGPGGGTVAGSVNISGTGALYTASGGNNAGYVALTGNNTYTGGTYINGVLLGISSEANIGGGSTQITINGNSTPSGLSIVGNGLTSLTNPIAFAAGAAGTIAFDIQSPTNTFTLSQALNLGTGSFGKYGLGTLVLTGKETYTGLTYLYGGILEVDASQGGSFGSGNLNLLGGTFELKGSGGTTVQNIGNLVNTVDWSNVNGHNYAAAGNIIVDNNGGNATLNIGTFADNGGASIAAGNTFMLEAKGSGTSIITTQSMPDSSTGLGSAAGVYSGRYVYVTADSSGNILSADWATGNFNGSSYTLGAYNNYVDLLNSPNPGTDNVSITGKEALPTSFPYTVNSVKIISNGPGNSFDLKGNPFTIASGGILFTGADNYTISDSIGTGGLISGLTNTTGAFLGATAGSSDLILQQYGTGILTISAAILNGGINQASTLTKAGPGTVVLSGSNSYSGQTFITGGVLSVSSTANLGGQNGVIAIASSSTTLTTVNLASSVTALPTGFGINSTFLGSTVTGISGSSGAYVITLAGKANVTASNTTASWASGGQTVVLNGGTLQVTNTLVAQTNSAGAVGGVATSTVPTLLLGGAGGGVNIIGGATYSTSVSTYLSSQAGYTSFTMDSTDGTGTLNAGMNFIGTITINGGTLNSNNGNPTSIQGNDPIVFGSGIENGIATHPVLSGSDPFLYVGGINSPAITTAIITGSGNALVITDGATDSYSGTITGSIRVIKGGGGTQSFTNTTSSYTGVTRIDDGTLNVGNLANGGLTTLKISTTGGSTSATLNSTVGLVVGTTYGIGTNANIPLGATFTYTGSTSITLSTAASTTASAVTSTIGVESSIGISSNAAANLLFGGYGSGTATLQYTGATAISTDRLFTLGDIDNAGVLQGNDGTIDASGSNPSATVSFTNTGAIAMNTGASAAFVHNLTLTGTNTGTASTMNTFAPSLGDGALPTSLNKTGTGSWAVTNANTYSGGTSVTGGTLYANNTTGSATGTGAVNVGAGGTLSGTGSIRPTLTSGYGVTVASGGMIAPGGVQPLANFNPNPVNPANGNLILDPTGIAGGKLLSVGVGSNAAPSMSFALGSGGLGSQIQVATGSTANIINFNAGGTGGIGGTSSVISINDLVGTSLNLNTNYVLIAGNGNTTYLDNGAPLELGATVLGHGQLIVGGLSLLAANTPGNFFSQFYAGSELFFNNDNIEIEVIPEPGTWAMMIGGFTLLILLQRRKRKLN